MKTDLHPPSQWHKHLTKQNKRCLAIQSSSFGPPPGRWCLAARASYGRAGAAPISVWVRGRLVAWSSEVWTTIRWPDGLAGAGWLTGPVSFACGGPTRLQNWNEQALENWNARWNNAQAQRTQERKRVPANRYPYPTRTSRVFAG
jgi:hypothetical protein